ncbi:MAG TPA: hypothetical protein VEP90_11490, partial [Methylomirabilota bacterium]|nr:hypothetical protein [Methylomirabilota bacterium]
MRRTLKLLILLLILFLIALLAFFIRFITPFAQTNAPNMFYKTHILGGFSINTPERATKAAADGIQVVFKYDQPPSGRDELGQKLQSLHMKVVDGSIWALVYYYECHRTKELRPSLLGPGQYCQDDPYPNLADENALLASVAAHLKQVKDNQLIIGYWVLDDWMSWDAGSAKQILIDIHKLIQQYTPDRPAICGLGGSIWLNQGYGWNDWIADNFSPEGCDRIGLYIYTSSIANTTRISLPARFNWSMTGLLPVIFTSLQQRGWDISKEPLIGIGQAFGGPIAHTDRYWVTPTAKDIETQSRSFCEHGATGLTFYAWNDSGFGPTTHTPMNSPEIEMGIRNGI